MSKTTETSFENKITLKEASSKLDVNEYVLSFWVKEFSAFGFQNTDFFSENDLKLAFLIKRLLYEECFTIKGVKRRLKGFNSHGMGIKDLSSEKNAIKDEFEVEKSEKNELLLQFSLDCKKNMDIISSEIESIIELTSDIS